MSGNKTLGALWTGPAVRPTNTVLHELSFIFEGKKKLYYMEKTGLTNTLLTTDLLPTEVLVLANKKNDLKKIITGKNEQSTH